MELLELMRPSVSLEANKRAARLATNAIASAADATIKIAKKSRGIAGPPSVPTLTYVIVSSLAIVSRGERCLLSAHYRNETECDRANQRFDLRGFPRRFAWGFSLVLVPVVSSGFKPS